MEGQTQVRGEAQVVNRDLSMVLPEAGWCLDLNLTPPYEGPLTERDLVEEEQDARVRTTPTQSGTSLSLNESEVSLAQLTLGEKPLEEIVIDEQHQHFCFSANPSTGPTTYKQTQFVTEPGSRQSKKRKTFGEKTRDKEVRVPKGKAGSGIGLARKKVARRGKPDTSRGRKEQIENTDSGDCSKTAAQNQ